MSPKTRTAFAALLAIGCRANAGSPATAAAAPPPNLAAEPAASAAPTASEDPPRATTTAPPHAKLHFRELNGQRFPFPLLRATVRGEPTWLMADTGASHHVLGSSLVRKLRIETRAAAMDARGHTGERVAVRTAERPEIALEGWGAVSGEKVLVTDLPAVFEKLELGGVLSPQALTDGTNQAVLLDFPGEQMELTAESSALAALVGAGYWLARCRDCVCGGERAGYVLPARVGGHEARLGVDSGAERTDLALSSAAGKKLAPRGTRGEKTATAGGQYTERKVEGVAVTVGDVSRQLDIALVPAKDNPSCPTDGNLGMDVLARCILVLTPRSFAARCQ